MERRRERGREGVGKGAGKGTGKGTGKELGRGKEGGCGAGFMLSVVIRVAEGRMQGRNTRTVEE